MHALAVRPGDVAASVPGPQTLVLALLALGAGGGAEKAPSLKAAVAVAAVATGMALTPDSNPERARLIRSDHYSFVQQR